MNCFLKCPLVLHFPYLEAGKVAINSLGVPKSIPNDLRLLKSCFSKLIIKVVIILSSILPEFEEKFGDYPRLRSQHFGL